MSIACCNIRRDLLVGSHGITDLDIAAKTSSENCFQAAGVMNTCWLLVTTCIIREALKTEKSLFPDFSCFCLLPDFLKLCINRLGMFSTTEFQSQLYCMHCQTNILRPSTYVLKSQLVQQELVYLQYCCLFSRSRSSDWLLLNGHTGKPAFHQIRACN